ncbi:MAG: 2-oxoglutarate dehydrogenase E1 component [Flammeovirgaceae bacterium]|jgi:2-oxoglutarate dehydrogenase E1 component|nr:2-oxoglutarate dehydrogenase E1 component [Flammeovirgaceae bacterium]
MDNYSYIGNADVSHINSLYEAYLQNPDSVDVSWRLFFQGYEFSLQNAETSKIKVVANSKETSVKNLIHAYRSRAHLKSDTNPVRARRSHEVKLSLADHGLTSDDLASSFEIGAEIGLGNAKLKDIIARLDKIYLGSIGYEYTHIRDEEILHWFRSKCEIEGAQIDPTTKEKEIIIKKLNEAVVFEHFLHTKYIGQKRFSLEGGENTIPALDKIIRRASQFGVKEVIIGMAHRGRLNVLANIMGKTYDEIFNEFEGGSNPDLTMGDGDVKYHLGYSSQFTSEAGNTIYVKLAPNPSHLEAVDPVVLGIARAQIDDEYRGDTSKCLPVIIHGDAAVAGQGIVYECVQMANLDGYRTGGTIHFVINNQVGFTTDYDDARSSIYCTDLSKIIDAPVLHVNGDDAEAVNFVTNLAVEYRQEFGKDIFIDLLCYRRHGHNESDEPKFTQPKLYNIISKHPNPREVYLKKLRERGDSTVQTSDRLDKEFKKLLQDRLNEVKQKPLPYKPQKIDHEWEFLRRSTPEDFHDSPDTFISASLAKRVAIALTTLPEGFKPLKQIEKLIKDRKVAFFEKEELGWAEGELLAYGSLLAEGKIVRMSGQDVKRGTFSHRHSYIFDSDTNDPYCHLNHVAEGQEPFRIFNSLLSEFGVLGFEYGYAMSTPNALVIWEAQFGDFVNGAQVMIDQFIVSAESKWQKMNGLVMLLPHGYEGQGPEHSSARLERFLQMCAQDNIIVVNLTTSANLFHMMRRQLAWEFRKPSVVFTPKSLLRSPKVASPIKDFTSGKFKELIPDDYAVKGIVKKVILCSGKIYFDLLEEQQKRAAKDVAIIRIEQLHPFPMKQLDVQLKKYKNPKLVWAQEEPENMGAWSYILRTDFKYTFVLVARKLASSPATGFNKIHKIEQSDLVTKAFNL